MRPLNFRGVTNNFTKPENWDEDADGECIDLPVMRTPGFGGHDIYTSVWRPDATERRLIQEGAEIVLHVWGCQPPVAVSIEQLEELEAEFND